MNGVVLCGFWVVLFDLVFSLSMLFSCLMNMFCKVLMFMNIMF